MRIPIENSASVSQNENVEKYLKNAVMGKLLVPDSSGLGRFTENPTLRAL
jgi:hypothetical protein